MVKRLWIWSVWALLLIVPVSVAAQAACSSQVEQALQLVEAHCQATERNQVCYGNNRLAAELRPTAATAFQAVGDLVGVADVQALRVSAFDDSKQEWGVALMKLQASLPDTLPGQNVTFLLFGDVEVLNAVDPDNTALKPMQAFYMRTGVTGMTCADAPMNGLLVQTPEGVSEVAFNINGVDVQMGSTVFFEAQADGEMRVSTLEGAAYITSAGESQTVIAGTESRLPLDALLQPKGAPLRPVAYDGGRLGVLARPLAVLERRVELALPATAAVLEQIKTLQDSGQRVCGDAPLPSCDKFKERVDSRACLPDGERPLSLRDRRPRCGDFVQRMLGAFLRGGNGGVGRGDGQTGFVAGQEPAGTCPPDAQDCLTRQPLPECVRVHFANEHPDVAALPLCSSG